MTAVLIHPTGVSRDNAGAADHWVRTIENAVPFRSGAFAAALKPDEAATLEQVHPDGEAHFWGAHADHRARLSRLVEDDVAVLTAEGRIRGVGRVGLVTTNAAFGDALWPHRIPGKGSFLHLYSLVGLTLTDLPLRILRDAGVAWFQSPLYLEGEAAGAVVVALGDAVPRSITEPAPSPVERAMQDALEYSSADAAVAKDLALVRAVNIEIRTAGHVPVRARPEATMHRGENLLVHDYVQHLPRGARWARYITPVGVTDLDVWADGRHELVEAKSSPARSHVRQALAQLLDYAPALADDPPAVLTALFPSMPDRSAVALLHRYGVDCVSRDDRGAYARLAAPVRTAAAVSALW